MIRINANFIVAFLSGFLVLVPVEVVPGLYLSYLSSLALLFYLRITRLNLMLFIFFSILVMSSSLQNSSSSILSTFVTIYTFLILSCTFNERFNLKAFLYGIKFATVFNLSMYMLALNSLSYFSLKYILVENREWFKDFLPYAGNGLAISYVIAMFFFPPTSFKSAVLAISSLLTTSRLSLFTLLAFIRKISMPKVFLIFITLIVVFLFFLNSQDVFDNAIGQRLIKSSDRIVTFMDNYNAFKSSPLFGVGSVDIGMYLHAHNSFLYILARHGIFAFLIFLFVVIRLFYTLSTMYTSFIFVILLVASNTQIALQNISIVILLISLLSIKSQSEWSKS